MQTTGYTQQGLIRLPQKTSERDKKERKKNLKTEDEFVPEWWEEKKRQQVTQQFLKIREIEEKSEMGSS